VGSALVGNKEFVQKARRFRKQFGGGMRQAGIIAAGALYAVDHHRPRLADDHANARRLASGLGDITGIRIDKNDVATNMVYFDVEKYHKTGNYGKLSGRIIEDLMANTRDLEGQDEKKSPLDFALWKKAQPVHIMRWPSPWSEGFPGWHIECSAMSSKYLGETFDIHGGGMDMMFPHHECEIAQSNASNHKEPVKYWMHNNMITIHGKKMGKSLGNFILLNEFFTGAHESLEKAYSPMTIRFFILQAHYRSTLDFSNDALQAAEKALVKVINGLRALKKMEYQKDTELSEDEILRNRIENNIQSSYEGLNDDLNSAVALASIFDQLKIINSLKSGQIAFNAISKTSFDKLKNHYLTFVEDILGIDEKAFSENAKLDDMMDIILKNYADAKARKEYDQVDTIRAAVKKLGLVIKDSKTSISWDYEE
jgi:cysteinyl-tRNA synthetase